MREIVFRGKRIDNGEWVYGSLVKYKNGTAAIYCEELNEHFPIPVIPETVGQYTGLDDKNGNRILEGDILRDTQGWMYEVKWDADNGRFLGHHCKPRGNTYICYVGKEPKSTIVGNIHDHKYLLEDDHT